jgi:hypothetical protein
MTEIVIDVVSPVEFALDQTGDEFGDAPWEWPRRIFDWENIKGVDHAQADRRNSDRNGSSDNGIGGEDLAA